MFYRLFRAYVRLALRIFFRGDGRSLSGPEVSGLEHVPRAGPVLVVANHVNGLVDPLLFVAALDRRLTLTAKNTLSRNPLLALLIRGLGIVLFHRAQDAGHGAELRENVRSLARCRELLVAGGALLLFPEGESHSDPGLRPFKTGAARIAADVRRQSPGLPLRVVPAGLYYTRKDRFRSGAALRFGPPLPLGDLLDGASRGAPAAQSLTAAADQAIRALALDLESEHEAEVVAQAAALWLAAARGPRLPGELVATAADELAVKQALHRGWRALSAHAPARLEALAARVGAHARLLDGLGLQPAELRVRHTPARSILFAARELEIATVGLPAAALGAAWSLPPYLLEDGLARLLSRDLDHWASHKLYPALALYPLCWAAQAGAVAALLGWPWALVAVTLLPLASLYALRWGERMQDAARRVATFATLARRPRVARALAQEGDAIHAELEALRGELGLTAGG